jgi:hypothetical protein
LFYTDECKETQIKNQFDPILGFGLVKNFWKWKFLSLNKDIFTKSFQRTHIIKSKLMGKKWDDNNLLDTLKKHSQFKKMWNSKTSKIQSIYTWKFKFSKLQDCFTKNKWGIMYMMY